MQTVKEAYQHVLWDHKVISSLWHWFHSSQIALLLSSPALTMKKATNLNITAASKVMLENYLQSMNEECMVIITAIALTLSLCFITFMLLMCS